VVFKPADIPFADPYFLLHKNWFFETKRKTAFAMLGTRRAGAWGVLSALPRSPADPRRQQRVLAEGSPVGNVSLCGWDLTEGSVARSAELCHKSHGISYVLKPQMVQSDECHRIIESFGLEGTPRGH